MTKPTRILFLDIDGVLNSARTCIAFGGYPMDLTPRDLPMFDQVAVGLIRGLCDKAGVSVVVSSAWRLTIHWDAIGRALDLPTIDRTPSLPRSRGHEIAAWLAEHPEVTEWAILDDDPDMLDDQLSRFVKTDGNEGLSWANFTRLCGLFGLNVHECSPSRIRINNAVKLAWEDA